MLICVCFAVFFVVLRGKVGNLRNDVIIEERGVAVLKCVLLADGVKERYEMGKYTKVSDPTGGAICWVSDKLLMIAM